MLNNIKDAPLARFFHAREAVVVAQYFCCARTSAQLAGTSVAGIAAPAALQVAVLDMYHEPTKRAVPKLMRGEVAALLDDASLAGTIGAVVAKSYAP